MIRLLVLVALLATASVGECMEPVTVQGQRFYSAGIPFFPTTHFLKAIPKSQMVYLSHKMTHTDRAKILSDLHAGGYNSFFTFLLNQGNYNGKSVTPYLDERGIIGGDFDEVKIQEWRAKLENIIAQGLRPFLWLFSDDSPKIKKAPIAELKRFIEKMVASFDDLPIAWVLALEADEYWSSEGEATGSIISTT